MSQDVTLSTNIIKINRADLIQPGFSDQPNPRILGVSTSSSAGFQTYAGVTIILLFLVCLFVLAIGRRRARQMSK